MTMPKKETGRYFLLQCLRKRTKKKEENSKMRFTAIEFFSLFFPVVIDVVFGFGTFSKWLSSSLLSYRFLFLLHLFSFVMNEQHEQFVIVDVVVAAAQTIFLMMTNNVISAFCCCYFEKFNQICVITITH